MTQAGQHGSLLPKVIAALCVIAVACTSPTGDTTATRPEDEIGISPPPSLSVQLPPQHLDGMHTTESIVADAVAASIEATHPDEVRDVLTSDGFVGAWERIYAGRVGAFARVVLRAWEFHDEQGASAYQTWLEQNPREWIGEAHPVSAGSLPPSVSLALHEPSGCCHEETPIYLASWRNRTIVWTIRASGPRISTPPVLTLVTAVEGKV
jgi:hypothetical protein